MPRIVRQHSEHEKNLMARGKTAKAKAAAKRQREREIDLLDTSTAALANGGTDTTPQAPAAPPPPKVTNNQAHYRMLTKQIKLQEHMLVHWQQELQKAGELEESNWKGFHALSQTKQVATEKATFERRLVELLKEDPDADK